MKNKETNWLKDALKWYAQRGYKLEGDVDNFWSQVKTLGKMVKGSKIVMGVSTAVGAISGYLLEETDRYNTEFHTGVDVLKENPEWLIFTFGALAVAGIAAFGIKKFEEWQEAAQIKLEKTQEKLERVQERTNEVESELNNRGIFARFRTKFNLNPKGEEVEEEDQDATQFSSNPPAQVKYKDEQNNEGIDPMSSQGIRPRNRHRVNDGSVPHMPPEYSRESYREKYFPAEQTDASLTGEGSVNSATNKGGDEIDLIINSFNNNGPSQQ